MKNNNPLLGCLLASIFFIFSFTACGAKQAVPKVRIAVPYSEYVQNFGDNYYTNWLEAQVNVEIEFVTITRQRVDDYLSALLSMDSSSVDAVMFLGGGADGLSLDAFRTLGEEGLILPLNEFLPDSNLGELIGENAFDYENLMVNGAVYGFPSVRNSRSERNAQTMWLNIEWLNALGLTIPTTAEELETVLTAFVVGDPNQNGIADELGLLGCSDDDSLQAHNFILNAFTYTDPDSLWLSGEDGSIRFVPASEAFRDGLRFCHQLYEKGLLDPRSYTCTKEQLIQLANSPVSVVGGFTSSSIADVLYQHNPEIMAQYIHIPPLMDANGNQYAVSRQVDVYCGAIVPANAENAALVYTVLDAMLRPDAALIAMYGEPTVDWDYAAKTDISIYGTLADIVTKNYIKDTFQNKNYNGIGPFYLDARYMDGVTWNGINSDTRYIDIRALASYEPHYSASPIDLPADISNSYGDLAAFVRENIQGFIVGDIDINDNNQWAKFLQGCADLGSHALILDYEELQNAKE